MKLAALAFVSILGCGHATTVTRAVIDCTVASRPQIESLILEFRQLLVGEAPNWQAVLDKAIAAGSTIGGCAIAELTQSREAAPGVAARAAGDPSAARAALEEFRAKHANGATFRTPKGDI